MITKTRLLFIFLLFMGVSFSFATIKKYKFNDTKITAQKYEVVDLVFNVEQTLKHPFETKFDVILFSPTYQKQVVPAFYAGNHQFIARFCGHQSGKWSYSVASEIKKYDGKEGTIEVTNTSYNNRKGSVVIPKNHPNHFFWEDGSPYFLSAFECDFLFALDYNQPNLKRTESFLNTVEQNHFNHIVMNVYAHDVRWKKDEKLKNHPEYEFGSVKEIFPFGGTNDEPDYSQLNVAFFNHLDRVIETLNDRDIVSHLMIYVWNKKVNWPKPNSKADNRYFDYVVKRYQAFSNLVWDISKEAVLYGNVGDSYILDRIERLHKLDSYHRLLTVHDYGFCKRNEESVDFIARQDWNLMLYSDMLNAHSTFADKPIFNIEHGGYEESEFDVFSGNYKNAEYCLRRNYECLFAGCYSTYYWQGCSWNVFIPDFRAKDDKHYQPKLGYFKQMYQFFTDYPFHQFKPAPQYNSSGYCLSNEKDTYLFYQPKESYKLSVAKIAKQAKQLSFQWFNTHTGEYSEVVEKSKVDLFTIPTSPWYMKDDVILILKVLKYKS